VERETPTFLGPLEGVSLNHWTLNEGRETPNLLGPLEGTSITGRQMKGGIHQLCWVP
jgi:hypothetical protein